MVSFVSFILRRKKEPNGTNKKSCPQEVGYADVSKALHLLHQISLASKYCMYSISSFLSVYFRL